MSNKINSHFNKKTTRKSIPVQLHKGLNVIKCIILYLSIK